MKAEIYNYRQWIETTDKNKLKVFFDEALASAGFNVLAELEYNFSPYGYTKIWLLAESHFAIHTFPEESKTYIELSSCNKEKHDEFLKIMERCNETVI